MRHFVVTFQAITSKGSILGSIPVTTTNGLMFNQDTVKQEVQRQLQEQAIVIVITFFYEFQSVEDFMSYFK